MKKLIEQIKLVEQKLLDQSSVSYLEDKAEKLIKKFGKKFRSAFYQEMFIPELDGEYFILALGNPIVDQVDDVTIIDVETEEEITDKLDTTFDKVSEVLYKQRGNE
jgi:hypothetical protein